MAASEVRVPPMRVLITADPYIAVPPVHYGGIERVIDVLVGELVRRGHDVTLVAHPGSHTPARLVPYGEPPHIGYRIRAKELMQVGSALWRERRDVDVVHSFGRLAALLPILPRRQLPKIQSYQRDGVPWTSVSHAVRLAGSSLVFTGCSSSVYRHKSLDGSRGGEWRTVFNCVDLSTYTSRLSVAPDAPLVFLGRLDPIKGAHDAIAIARGAGRRLVIAGNRVTDGPDAGYFDARIAPHIDDVRVRYVGPVDDCQKNRLLGEAAALLMPIAWEEPFGIVMAEACACGTPVDRLLARERAGSRARRRQRVCVRVSRRGDCRRRGDRPDRSSRGARRLRSPVRRLRHRRCLRIAIPRTRRPWEPQ